MFCTQCGGEIKDEHRFCPKCGKPLSKNDVPPPPARPPAPRLARLMSERKIAGVCAGLARYLNMDVTLMRVLWVVLVFFAGTGLLAYLVLWIVMPKEYANVAARAQ
jgi:phage shock protein C